jgi:uncharacterized protein (TIGR04255 family)
MARRQYKNPPIHEAVCLIHFAPGEDWNPIYPALLWEKVKGVYSGKPREQKIMNFLPNADAAKGTSTNSAMAMAVNEITRIQYVTPDGKKILGVNQDDLSVSVLRPYPGWDNFKPLIHDALRAYIDVVHPSGIRRIGLRYINPMEIEGSLNDLLGCLTFPPHTVPEADANIGNFNSRIEYVFNDAPIKVAVGTVLLTAPEGRSSCLLDIDMVWEWPAEALSLQDAMGKIDDLRARERVIFESHITDKARRIFDA